MKGSRAGLGVLGLRPVTRALRSGKEGLAESLEKDVTTAQAPSVYFQASSFAQVPAGQVRYGTAGRDILRGPGFFDLDTGLQRTFRITEHVNFQFRANAFAVTNTPNFGNPQTNISQPNLGVITGTASGPQFSSEAGNLTGQRTWWFAGKVIF